MKSRPIDLVSTSVSVAACLALFFCIYAGSERTTLPSDIIEVDTRGIPIVAVVIEGPGGDLLPVQYSRTDRSVIIVESLTYMLAVVATLVLAVVALTIEVLCRVRRRSQPDD